MSARKLQQEMDRVFKRVGEGCAVFDTIYNKLQSSSNQSQKEKLEQDLKREIKKLQKLRDQIKTWIASNDVRDKKQLMEQRRLIENDMERFKVVEREIKTKAYSKEGLSRSNDPYAKEKQEANEFLQNKSEELEQQIEELEEEQEQLQSSSKKGKKDGSRQERINEIDHFLERHKWHISKMDIMMSMIDQDKLAPESIMDLQEDINYYVESNQDLDFAEDEAIYDELNLVGDDEHEIVETIVRDDTYTLEDLAQDLSKEAAKEAAQKEKNEKERDKREKEKLKSPPPVANASSASLAGASAPQPAAPSAPQPAAPLPSNGNGVLGSGTVSTHTSISPIDGRTPSPARRSQSPSTQPALNPLPPPSLQGSQNTEPFRKTVDPAQAAAVSISNTLSPQSSHNGLSGQSAPASRSSSVAPVSSETRDGSVAPSSSSLTQTQSSFTSQSVTSELPQETTINSGPPGLTPQHGKVPQRKASSTSPEDIIDVKHLPPGLQDLVHCFDAARQRLSDPSAAFRIPSVAKLVHDSFLNTPDAHISDQPRYYHPQNPYPTPDYYPQDTLLSLEDPAVFREMHVDTLFYIFYYCQSTHQQYLAAKELKLRSWRFHKQFLTWFQRQEDPQTITSDYEEGTYRFFDFEGSWVQRRKTNFKFEFKYLENEI